MRKITKTVAIHDLAEFVFIQDQILHGAVGVADFGDSEVRALLLDQLEDEVNTLRVKWGVKAGGNDGK